MTQEMSEVALALRYTRERAQGLRNAAASRKDQAHRSAAYKGAFADPDPEMLAEAEMFNQRAECEEREARRYEGWLADLAVKEVLAAEQR